MGFLRKYWLAVWAQKADVGALCERLCLATREPLVNHETMFFIASFVLYLQMPFGSHPTTFPSDSYMKYSPHTSTIFQPGCVFFLCLILCLRTKTSELPSQISISSSLSTSLQWETSAGPAHVCQPLLAILTSLLHSLPSVSPEREWWGSHSNVGSGPRPLSRSPPCTHTLLLSAAQGGAWFKTGRHLAWGLCQENILQPEAMAQEVPWSLLSIRTTWWHVQPWGLCRALLPIMKGAISETWMSGIIPEMCQAKGATKASTSLTHYLCPISYCSQEAEISR